MESMKDLATKADLKQAVNAATLRISVMLGLMVAVLLAATYVMTRALWPRGTIVFHLKTGAVRDRPPISSSLIKTIGPYLINRDAGPPVFRPFPRT